MLRQDSGYRRNLNRFNHHESFTPDSLNPRVVAVSTKGWAGEPWGVKVSVVEIKDVELPDSMQRAMAKQAEAEREKRAKIIHAQGEFEASARLADAADQLNRTPTALQLRYMQTLTEIAVEKNSTIIFPLPIDLITALLPNLAGRNGHTPLGDVPAAPILRVE